MERSQYYPTISPRFIEETAIENNVYFLLHLTTVYLTKGERPVIIDKLFQALLKDMMTTTSPYYIEGMGRLSRTPELFTQLPVQKIALGLSKAFDLSPGAALNIIWPNWARSVYQEHLQRFVDFAVNIMNVAPCNSDEETALKGIHAMEKFCRGFHFPATLEDAGIFLTDTEMSELIKSCLPQEEVNEKAAIYLILKNSQ